MKIVVRFSARALAGGNAGLDLDASGERYREALVLAVAADYPAAEIDVARDDAAPRIAAEGVDGARRVEVERSVADLAWVVKQCAPWGVPG
ncbi:MAG: hypothetical protein U0234_22170 [Sandaracinus sp.]